MDDKPINLSPLGKKGAFFLAYFCCFAALLGVVDVIFAFPSIYEVVVGIGRVLLLVYGAWCLWYLASHGKNPFKAKPFDK